MIGRWEKNLDLYPRGTLIMTRIIFIYEFRPTYSVYSGVIYVFRSEFLTRINWSRFSNNSTNYSTRQILAHLKFISIFLILYIYRLEKNF